MSDSNKNSNNNNNNKNNMSNNNNNNNMSNSNKNSDNDNSNNIMRNNNSSSNNDISSLNYGNFPGCYQLVQSKKKSSSDRHTRKLSAVALSMRKKTLPAISQWRTYEISLN
jgi:hypothetical protein